MTEEQPAQVCAECGKEGYIFDKKNMLCAACSGKKGGRPKKKKPPIIPPEIIPASEDTPDTAWNIAEEEPEETEEQPEKKPEYFSLVIGAALAIGAAALFWLFGGKYGTN